jgi:hypothetical protein
VFLDVGPNRVDTREDPPLFHRRRPRLDLSILGGLEQESACVPELVGELPPFLDGAV